jgi:competence protein ComEA
MVVFWSWPLEARVMLAGLAIVGALGLLAASLGGSSAKGPSPAVLDLVLDPNTAPAEVLAALPRFGPAMTERMVAARDERPFSSLEDLQDRVRGVGPVTLARLAPHLRIEPVTKSDLSTKSDQVASKSRRSKRKTITTRRLPSASLDTRLARSP